MKRSRSKSSKQRKRVVRRVPGPFGDELRRSGINTRTLARKLGDLVNADTPRSGTAAQALLRAVQECLRHLDPMPEREEDDEAGVELIHEVARPERGQDEEDETGNVHEESVEE